MTSIDFYFNAGDRLAIACRLAGKALRQKKRVLIHAPQAELAQKIDRLLWTTPAVSFVPHCYVGDALAAQTPVLIGSGEEPPTPHEVLLNLGEQYPPWFERYERLLEVVPQEDAQRDAGRARASFYKSRGYPIRYHDLSIVGGEAAA